MARRGRAGGITNLRFLVRPRRLETRTERGFPHFPSNGGYCSLAHLKRQTRQNRGVRQILAQNRRNHGAARQRSALILRGALDTLPACRNHMVSGSRALKKTLQEGRISHCAGNVSLRFARHPKELQQVFQESHHFRYFGAMTTSSLANHPTSES